jgi:hypothetical protein
MQPSSSKPSRATMRDPFALIRVALYVLAAALVLYAAIVVIVSFAVL